MRIPLLLSTLCLVWKQSNGYSQYEPYKAKALSQKSVVAQTMGLHMLQRETIRMPSQKPMVPYKPPGSDYAQFIDIEAAMYRDRTIMISNFINDEYANSLIAIILYLRKENPRDPISMYFNVPGASLRPALAVYDLIQQTKVNCEVETVNLGLCVGMGAILCSAGTKGKRSAMPNSRFLIHRTGMDQAFRGQATDIALEVRNIKACNDRMEAELAALTGQKLERIQKDLSRDFYLTSDEAVQYGLIDRVLLPNQRKRAARGKRADLGAFEGEEEQRYQGEQNKGGWGSRREADGDARRRSDDEDEPKIAKG